MARSAASLVKNDTYPYLPASAHQTGGKVVSLQLVLHSRNCLAEPGGRLLRGVPSQLCYNHGLTSAADQTS
jgi:hypothetical protein